MSKEVERIEEILQTRQDLRSSEDVETLFEWVLKNSNTHRIFNGVQDVICKTICREMSLVAVEPQTLICSQGAYGDTFYIIISGSVSLYLKVDKPPNDGQQEKEEDENDDEENELPVHDAVEEMPKVSKETLGKFIKSLHAGGTFGEIAVMDPTAKRSCSILANVATSMIGLKRNAYQRLVRTRNTQGLDFTQMEFLQSLYLFDKWPQGDITRLSNRLRPFSFPADSFLARHGAECIGIYLILSGKVEESIPMMSFSEKDGKNLRYALVEHMTNERELQTFVAKNQIRRRINLELSTLEEHDICGEYPVTSNKSCHHIDLRAVTDVKALLIDRDTWSEIFLADQIVHIERSLSSIREVSVARENWRRTRINIAIAHPGLLLTISTRTMMKDVHIHCGWCGLNNHVTGDSTCPKLLSLQQIEAERNKRRRMRAMHRGRKSSSYRNILPQLSGHQNNNNMELNTQFEKKINLLDKKKYSDHSSLLSGRELIKKSLSKISYLNEIPEKDINHADPPIKQTCKMQCGTGGNGIKTTSASLKNQRTSDPSLKIDQMSTSVAVYKQNMYTNLKKLKSLSEFQDKRDKVLSYLTNTELGNVIHVDPKSLKKPKVPKPTKRIAKKRPSKFNRRLERKMKNIWPNENRTLRVEESLKFDLKKKNNCKSKF